VASVEEDRVVPKIYVGNTKKSIKIGDRGPFDLTSLSVLCWPVHLLSEDVSSLEDSSTSWPSK
jgi:hypothetical protein